VGGFNFSVGGDYSIPLPPLSEEIIRKSLIFCKDLESKIKPNDQTHLLEKINKHLEKISSYLSSKNKPFSSEEKKIIKELCLCYFLPEGPLRYFLHDPDLEEICCNGLGPENPLFVFSREKSQFLPTNLYFTDFDKLRTLINNLTALHAGRRMDLNHPYVMALINLNKRKFRITAVQERATSTSRIQFSIRKYSHTIYTPADLIRFKTIDPKTTALLWMIFQCGQRTNLLIVGRPASGKTTFLQAMTLFIPHNQRIIDAEYQPELSLFQKNVAGLMSRPEEGLTMAKLIELCERYRPDRLIIGEVVSKEEMLSLIDAAGRATGEGIYATYHANSASTALQTIYLNIKDHASPLDLCNINLIATIWPIRKLDENGMETFERKLVELVEVTPELENNFPLLNPLFNSETSWSKTSSVFKKLSDYFGSKEKFQNEWETRTRILEQLSKEQTDPITFYEFIQSYSTDPEFRKNLI
jgi:type IV secretory pathway ATPase VirB11/archaellum biosynthesis ATPase